MTFVLGIMSDCVPWLILCLFGSSFECIHMCAMTHCMNAFICAMTRADEWFIILIVCMRSEWVMTFVMGSMWLSHDIRYGNHEWFFYIMNIMNYINRVHEEWLSHDIRNQKHVNEATDSYTWHDTTHSYMWHDSSIRYGTRVNEVGLSFVNEATDSYMWHGATDSICDMTHSSFVRLPQRIHTCDVTHS